MVTKPFKKKRHTGVNTKKALKLYELMQSRTNLTILMKEEAIAWDAMDNVEVLSSEVLEKINMLNEQNKKMKMVLILSFHLFLKLSLKKMEDPRRER